MPASSRPEPTAAERKTFGDLADDVAYLRQACGLLVAPFKGEFRINTDVVDKDGLRARAQRERIRRNHVQPAKTLPTPAPGPVAHPAPVLPTSPLPKGKPIVIGLDRANLCGCGRALNHYGRCWVRRGKPGPEGRAADKRTIGERLDALEAEIIKLRDQVGRVVASR